MRDPDNMHKLYEYIEEPPEVFDASDIPPYDLHDWDLNDEKELKKFIKHIEMHYIRHSFEYRRMIQFMKNYMNMNECSYFINVNSIDSPKVRIEIHHDPFDLYTITKTVYNKRLAFYESIAEEDIALEVMYLHYSLMIGLIPVSVTVHDLIHNQYLLVPLDKVLGNYQEFYDRYKPWMDPECIEIYEKLKNLAVDYSEDYKTLLSKQYIYINMGENDPNILDTLEEIKQRISDLVDNPPMPIGQVPQQPIENQLIIPIIYEE